MTARTHGRMIVRVVPGLAIVIALSGCSFLEELCCHVDKNEVEACQRAMMDGPRQLERRASQVQQLDDLFRSYRNGRVECTRLRFAMSVQPECALR